MRTMEETRADPGRRGCLEGFLEEAALNWALEKRTLGPARERRRQGRGRESLEVLLGG